MRIVIDEYLTCDLMDAPTYNAKGKFTGMAQGYDVDNTIEITDSVWNEIYAAYYLYVESNIQYDGTTVIMPHKTFAQYLRELMEMKRYNSVTTLGR